MSSFSGCLKVQHPMFLFVDGDTVIAMLRIAPSPLSLRRLRHEIAPADQVVRGGGEGKDPIDEASASVAELPQQADRFQPAEGLLDQLPLPLAVHIAGMTRGAAVNGAAAVARRGGLG